MEPVASVLVAFFLGSIPFSWILIRLGKGIDLREVVIGNPGATNAWRAAGARWGISALILDIAKGWTAVAAAPLIVPDPSGDWLPALCGCSAILGNVFCPFLRFKGGKAVSTASGVFLGLTPWGFLITVVFFALVVWRTGKMSAASLTGAILLPLIVTFEGLWAIGDASGKPVIGLVWIAAGIVVLRHKANIGRLLRGEEKAFLTRQEGKDNGAC